MNPRRLLLRRPFIWVLVWAMDDDHDTHQNLRHPNPWHCQHGRHHK